MRHFPSKSLLFLWIIAIALLSCEEEEEELEPVASVTAITGLPSNITSTSASVEVILVAVGVPAIVAKGVCWSLATPTVLDSKTNDGNGTANFSSTITGLTGNTIYNVRAYTTDNTGNTTYANQISFTTTATGTGTGTALNGNWIQNGQDDLLIINTSAATGLWHAASFTPTPEYQVVINNGQATVATPFLKNIVNTSATTWTCSRFTFSFTGSGSSAIITNVNYITATITLAGDGRSFTLVGIVGSGLGYPPTFVGQTLTSVWTKQ